MIESISGKTIGQSNMHIIVSRKGTPVSLYDTEKFFQDNKNKRVINLSEEATLNRFRLGVKQKEIKPFKITVKDLDKTLRTEICDNNGKLCEIWKSNIFRTWEDTLIKLL